MRRILLLVLLAGFGVGGWWLYKSNPDIFSSLEQYVENGEFMTLEVRYTAEQIMEKHRKELLVDNQHTFQDPALKYHPYLLIEAKFVQADKKTREGSLLWGLVDGEMVIDADTWEKTHGF